MNVLFTELAASLKFGLALWLHKDKNKYVDEVHKLENEYELELRKPVYEGPSGEIPKEQRADYRDHRVLDDLDRRLCNLSRTIRAAAGGTDAVLQ